MFVVCLCMGWPCARCTIQRQSFVATWLHRPRWFETKNILISRSDTAFVDANGERIHSGIFRVAQSINQTDWQGVTKRRPVSINANHQMSVASLFISIFLGQKEGELFWSCGTAHSYWQPIIEEYFAFGFILRNWNVITIVSIPLRQWNLFEKYLGKRMSCTHRGSGFFKIKLKQCPNSNLWKTLCMPVFDLASIIWQKSRFGKILVIVIIKG